MGINLFDYASNGVLWDSDLEDKKVHAQLRKETEVKPKYSLYVEFADYPGNFEREFIAYVFGRLPNDYSDKKIKPYFELFWSDYSRFLKRNSLYVNNVNSYADYINLMDNLEDVMRKNKIKFFNSSPDLKAILDKNPSFVENFESDVVIEDILRPLYDKLQSTWQDVDDWYEHTWYNIAYDLRNPNGINSLRIQFSEPLTEKEEKFLISRMKKFCDKKVFNTVEKYASLSNGYSYIHPDIPTIIRLDLVDKDKNILKSYDINDERFEECFDERSIDESR